MAGASPNSLNMNARLTFAPVKLVTVALGRIKRSNLAVEIAFNKRSFG